MNGERGTLEVRAVLPREIRSFLYVRNHHYIELTDAEGHTIKLVAKSMIRGDCKACSQPVYVESRIGAMTCPHCFGSIGWVWGKAQMAFVPEVESEFITPASITPPPLPNIDEEEA